MRAYANIADELSRAGYKEKEIEQIKADVKYFEHIREIVQLASGDYVDLKQYEPAMRHLIDSYIDAESSKVLANFDDFSLIDLLVERGEEKALEALPEAIKNNHEAMAEAIENNLRKVIIERSTTNPIYYEKMSVLLDEIIKLKNQETLDYQTYLQKIITLSTQVKKPETSNYPSSINTNPKRALYDNLGKNEVLAIALDTKIRRTKKPGFRQHKQKSRAVRVAIKSVLANFGITDEEEIYRVFELVKIKRNIKWSKSIFQISQSML